MMGNRQSNEHGITAVSLAVTLPLLLLLTFSSIELFLYLRAVGIVNRAAGEAAAVMAAANPQGSKTYTPNDLSGDASTIVTSKSGGTGNQTLEEAFLQYGQAYGSFAGATNLPFQLARAKNTVVGDGDPGVMYLPMVRVYTCLRPRSENVRDLSSCAAASDIRAGSSTLTYQLPTKLDFDGDGSEDLAFFDQNDGADWWIIPSSSGTFFRYAMSFESSPEPDANSTFNRPQWLPCPADYDDDGKTDICSTALSGAKIKIRLRLSSQYYFPNPEIELNAGTTLQIAPVPGKWSSAPGDQFAVIVLESSAAGDELNTLIYSSIKESASSSFVGPVYEIADNPTTLSAANFKPRAGNYFRPAYGDHDGNGLLDVGWLEWPGGNLTYHIASSGEGITSETEVNAREVKMRPWGIHYSPSGIIFVVERLNHRVSVLVSNEAFPGKNDSVVTYRRLVGTANPSAASTYPSPNPTYLNPLDLGSVPKSSGDKGCLSCPTGGVFNSDSGTANQIALNTPTDIADLAGPGKPAFVADFGNYRVRRVDPEATSFVKWGNENIATQAGGLATVDCLTLHGSGPSAGGQSVEWSGYTAAAQAAGIHPSCVNLRPLSLEVMRGNGQQLLFIGDARGAIFALNPGADLTYNSEADSTERLYLFAGTYGYWSKNAPATGLLPAAITIGQPVDLALATISGTPVLHIVIQNSGLPAASSNSTGPANTGGVIRISSGADKTFLTADDVTLTSWGDFIETNLRTDGTYTSVPASFSLRNPTSIAMRSTLSNMQDGIFVSNWWKNNGDEPYENSILRLVRTATTVSASTFPRWLNREHSNSWGMRAPNYASEEHSQFIWSTAQSLSALPVLPGGGVGLSSDGKFLAFSEPARSIVMLTLLDQDGDATFDASDNDIDGDGTANASESALALFQPPASYEPSLLDDPVMWAENPSGSIQACTSSGCDSVSRLSWWIDRATLRGVVPLAAEPIEIGWRELSSLLLRTVVVGPPEPIVTIPKGEEGMFMIFNEDTIAVPNGRGAVVNGEVYSGGPSRETEINPVTGRPLLAPLVMGSPSPSQDQLKSVKGYDHCAWGTSVFDSTMNGDGEPVTTCSTATSAQEGVRRAHLSHWTNQWHPWEAAAADKIGPDNEIAFIDWDGDGVRNPVVFKNDVISESSAQPLIAHIGNITEGELCPGSFASDSTPSIESLSELLPILSSKLALNLTQNATPQFNCQDSLVAFSNGTTNTVSVMVDTHAEWQVYNEHVAWQPGGITGDRLSLGADGDGDPSAAIGPVAEAAYLVLEHSLKVSSREDKSNANGAKVEFSSPTAAGMVTVSVSYVYPFNTFISTILGMEKQTITAQVTRRMYK